MAVAAAARSTGHGGAPPRRARRSAASSSGPPPHVVAPKDTTLKPLANRVLVKINSSEEKTTGGIFLPTTARSVQTSGWCGEVVSVGEGKIIGDKKVDVSIQVEGQVVYSKCAGTEVELNDRNPPVLKEDDIIGILETNDVKDMKPPYDHVLIKVVKLKTKLQAAFCLPK